MPQQRLGVAVALVRPAPAAGEGVGGDGQELDDAVAVRSTAGYRAAFEAAMKDYDFVLTPAACGEAPEGLSETGSASFNRDWTLLGVPCLAVPAYKGRKDLPIGVQVVGPYGADRDTLAWAEWTRRTLNG